MTNAEYIVPVKLVVNEEKLLEHIGWRRERRDEDGYSDEIGKADLPKDLASQVATILANYLLPEMRKSVQDAFTDAARARINDLIDEALTTGFRKTNHYGEPVGEPVTLREMVMTEIQNQLERKVDANGRTPSGYHNNSMSYLDYVAKNGAAEALNGRLSAAVKDAVDKVHAGVSDIVSAEFASKVARAITR